MTMDQNPNRTPSEPGPSIFPRDTYDHMAMGQNPNRLALSEHPIQSNH